MASQLTKLNGTRRDNDLEINVNVQVNCAKLLNFKNAVYIKVKNRDMTHRKQ